MDKHSYGGLRLKLVRPFALLGLFVSAVLSAITFIVVADLDERTIERTLLIEMEDFRMRRARNPAALPISTAQLQGAWLPTNLLPGLSEKATQEPRFIELSVGDVPHTALVTLIDGQPIAFLHNDAGSRAMLVDLAWLLFAATALMTVVATLVGLRLAGQVVQPITRLLKEITEQAQRLDPLSEARAFFSPEHYPNNEIGHLVQALEHFAERLRGFIRRERYFVGDVSHELRTPIAIIQGASEVLSEAIADLPDLPPAVKQRVALINRKSAKLAELVQAMLLLAREESGRQDSAGYSGDVACSLADVLAEAIADCAPILSGKPVRIDCQVSERPFVAAEKSMAYVVISNLLRNACAHTREGRIAIQLDATTISIEDTGIGIPADRFPDIFRRHVKGDESRGSGLGLSIVTRLVDIMGWRIDIDSHQGVGTRVAVRFADPAGTSAESAAKSA
jgi:signal transduction histidine kinase